VAQVEVDEVFSLMCDKGAEISSYDAVPSWAFSLVELNGCQIICHVCCKRGFVRTVFLMYCAISCGVC
jgi:hypothetical protein